MAVSWKQKTNSSFLCKSPNISSIHPRWPPLWSKWIELQVWKRHWRCSLGVFLNFGQSHTSCFSLHWELTLNYANHTWSPGRMGLKCQKAVHLHFNGGREVKQGAGMWRGAEAGRDQQRVMWSSRQTVHMGIDKRTETGKLQASNKAGKLWQQEHIRHRRTRGNETIYCTSGANERTGTTESGLAAGHVGEKTWRQAINDWINVLWHRKKVIFLIPKKF